MKFKVGDKVRLNHAGLKLYDVQQAVSTIISIDDSFYAVKGLVSTSKYTFHESYLELAPPDLYYVIGSSLLAFETPEEAREWANKELIGMEYNIVKKIGVIKKDLKFKLLMDEGN